MLQKPGGTVCRLTPSNFEELRAILDKGAVAYGLEGEFWDRKRVKYVIKQAFNIDYDVEHISAISPTGIIVSDIREDSFDGQAIVDFLRKILMTFKKEIHLIWDGAKIHAGQVVKEFLLTEPEAKRLFLYHFGF